MNKQNIINKENDVENNISVINGLGKKAPLSLAWLEQDEYCDDEFEPSKHGSKKKTHRSSVKISRPMTRSQKNIMTEDRKNSGNSAPAPGRVTRAKKQKNRSK